MKRKALYVTQQDMGRLRAVIEVYGGDGADVL